MTVVVQRGTPSAAQHNPWAVSKNMLKRRRLREMLARFGVGFGDASIGGARRAVRGRPPSPGRSPRPASPIQRHPNFQLHQRACCHNPRLGERSRWRNEEADAMVRDQILQGIACLSPITTPPPARDARIRRDTCRASFRYFVDVV